MSFRTSATSASRAAPTTVAAACHDALTSNAAIDAARAVCKTRRRRPGTVLARITFSPRLKAFSEGPRPLRSHEGDCWDPHEPCNLIQEKDNASRPNLPVGERHNFSRRVDRKSVV